MGPRFVVSYIVWLMDGITAEEFADVYARFHAPIAALDCGQRCAPYNEGGAPFCCDTHHVVPAAYQTEWKYLQDHTDLWHLWEGRTPAETAELTAQAPEEQVLIECKGYLLCQRNFRSLACRAFPFFPYITLQGQFIGLSVYWEYEDRCWVINNLQVVSRAYREEFFRNFDHLFTRMPEEFDVFRQFSMRMRRVFGRRHSTIPLFHRNGSFYKISPRTGRGRRAAPETFHKYGLYKIAAQLPFPDELALDSSTPGGVG
jgi:hypothetical protein